MANKDQAELARIKNQIIEKSCLAWLDKNINLLDEIFDPSVYYNESWGPEYFGLEQVKAWFNEWNKTGTVVDWSIKNILHDGDKSAFEWHFRAEYTNDKQADDFDGATIIRFNDQGKIVELKEFASKLPHRVPYGSEEKGKKV